MKLASQLEAHGMAASMELRQDIYSIIMQHRPSSIIETGTYNGLGSTSAILHGLKDANIKGFSFVSMESNEEFYRQAKKNLEQETYNGSLLLLNMVSVPSYMLPVKVYDVPEDVITDHVNPDKYLNEIPDKVKDDGIATALSLVNFRPDLVLLDSAGHLGTIEFDYMLELCESPFILILDDTLHRKHYKTLEKVKMNPARFEILKESKNKFGHAIIQVK